MKKKIVTAIIALSVCTFMLAGCGKTEGTTNGSTVSEATTETDTLAEGNAANATTDANTDGSQSGADSNTDAAANGTDDSTDSGNTTPGNFPNNGTRPDGGNFNFGSSTTTEAVVRGENDAEYVPAANHDTITDAVVIKLDNDSATVNGEAVKEYDYKWCIDPSQEKPWYEGEEPTGEDDVYIAHDIVYYPELNADGFSQEDYDGETEWVYRYTAEGLEEYIFATLPTFMGTTTEIPSEMMHTAEEAYENKVLHITKAGTYILEGEWHGQIYIDLGDKDETFTDENAKVTIYLNGVDVTCDVNAAFIAYSAYECDNGWEDRGEYSGEVDTSDAGVKVVVCDGTKNNFTGANVYRLLKAAYKKEGSTKQKKLYKVDGAFYSYVSMNIYGEENDAGILNITSTTFEGLDTELHLTINGGNITIYSQDDGINVNEDDVSVFTMNGGTLHIFAGLGREGDCVDSNGYATVNGGTIAAGTPSGMDETIDTNNGKEINGGTVISIGSSDMQMGSFNPGNMGGNFGGNGDGTGFPGGNGQMPEGFSFENMTPPTDNTQG